MRLVPVALCTLATLASAQRLIQLDEPGAAERMARMRASWQTSEDWQARAESIRHAVLEVMGLDIPDDRGPLNARVTDVRTYDGYVVEDVIFESFPGSTIAGNLYRPTDNRGRHPGVLCPHGHFQPHDGDGGRFRPDMQIRCAALARMGAVVFTYDMVAWGESDIADHQVPEALPLQTYNSIRVVDYLVSRPDVDPDRLAVTGASGGGSQSFLLTAIDDRIDASIPTVMVSSHFFGGCPCETGKPIHDGVETNNVEIAAMAAPRPLLVISCGKDWTSHTPEIEYPYIREVYAALGVPDGVENAHFADEGHDYGVSKRSAMYEFLARHFDLDIDRIRGANGELDESFVTIEPRETLLAREEPPARRPASEAFASIGQK